MSSPVSCINSSLLMTMEHSHHQASFMWAASLEVVVVSCSSKGLENIIYLQ